MSRYSLSTMVGRVVPLVLALLLCFGPAYAQTPSPTPVSVENQATALQKELEDIQKKLQSATDAPTTPRNRGGDEPPHYFDSLRRHEVTLRRSLTLNNDKNRLLQALVMVQEELETVTAQGLSEPKPYSVALLDMLQAENDLFSEKGKAAKLAYTAAETTHQQEKARLEEYQALRRRLLDKSSDKPNDLLLKRELEEVEAALEASEAGVRLAVLEMESADLERQINQARAELVRLKIKLVGESFNFSSDTLQDELEKLDQLHQEFNETLRHYKNAADISKQKLQSLQGDEIDDNLQQDEISARQEWISTHQRKERLVEERLEFNLLRRDLWERRYLAHADQAVGSYSEWQDSARGVLVRLSKNRELLNSELNQVRTQLAEVLSREETRDPLLEQWHDVEAQALINRQKALEDALNYHLETESLAKRLLAELEQQKATSTVEEKLSAGWSNLTDFWNIELYTLGDSSVTVGKLSVAITVLILGLAMVGRVTRFFSRKLFAVLPVQENVRVNLERLFRYLLTLLVFLFSLHVVNIPLTIFTFLGGTLAIAVGFGAQNILNNFISGLILMVERPVRVGDLVEVDDSIGTVEEIGARSTRILVPTGIHVILPNSTLLENKVVNWTLEDKRVRTKVEVGVAYGSPTRQVVELLQKATEREKAVLSSPAPAVTFDQFADSSLNFTVHFWVKFNNLLELELITTRVRLHIDDLFREHHIEIPFPQRDLNFSKPVPVEIVKDQTESQEEE